MSSKRDQTILSDLQKAKNTQKDFDDLTTFYEGLFLIQFEFKDNLASNRALYLQKKEINLLNFAKGIPQVTFNELDLTSTPFMELYHRVKELLIPYTGCVELNENPRPEIIIGYAQEVFASREPLVASGPYIDIIKTASGFVLAPYLQQLCELIMPRLKQNEWCRAYCPICGGLPSFAALTGDSGLRTLFCSRCNGEWTYSRVGCPFCNKRDSQTYYSSEDGEYRLYICDTCHRYLKTVDTRKAKSALCLPVKNILTVSMDIAAQEQGYRPY